MPVSPYKVFLIRFFVASFAVLALIFLFNYVVDPFQYNGVRLLRLEREEISRPISRNVLAASQFRNFSGDTVIFGDSVMRSLPADAYGQSAGVNAFNFSIGGASLVDMADVVDYVRQRRPAVRTFILGIPFREFDDSRMRATFVQNAGIVANSVSVNTSAVSLRASFENLLFAATGVRLSSDVPTADRDTFWRQSLDSAAAQMRWRIGSTAIRQRLLDAVCALAGDGARVIIVAPPAHRDVRAIWLAEAGDSYRDYKAWLRSLGTVYDFDIDSPLTADADNFHDPLHVRPEIAARVAAALHAPDRAIVDVSTGGTACSAWTPAGAPAGAPAGT